MSDWSPTANPPADSLTHSEVLRRQMRALSDENTRLRAENRQLRQDLQEQKDASIEDVMEHFRQEFEKGVAPAQEQVKAFALRHADTVDRVHMALCSGHVCFLFVLQGPDFDWDFDDELGDLQTDLLEATPFAVSCSQVPGGCNNEQYMVDATLSTLNVN